MRILVTNDDGVSAPGIGVMEELARGLSGNDNIWTVAPMLEQSGTGHCVSYVQPFRVSRISKRRYGIYGTPADCILAGIHHIMDDPPDLVLSGVNRGNNAGENTLYSGTVGAAMEGALQGIKSIAVSQFMGPANRHLDDPFCAAREHGLKILQELLSFTPWDKADYSLFLNVNFPPCASDDVKGMRVVHQGFRRNAVYGTRAIKMPSGSELLAVVGSNQLKPAGAGSDVESNLAGYVSVTPMRADLTDYATMHKMAGALHG